VSQALPQEKRKVINEVTREIARKSLLKGASIEKYLKDNHYDYIDNEYHD
jgi:hypothetical protein